MFENRKDQTVKIHKSYFREQTAAEVTSDFIDMYIEVPVEEWGTILRETDFPDLRLTMCTYFVTAMTLLYPEDTVDELAAYLLELLNEDGMYDKNKNLFLPK